MTGNGALQSSVMTTSNSKIVYDMRFEVASAKYGIFSDFYVGTIIDAALLLKKSLDTKFFFFFERALLRRVSYEDIFYCYY